MEKYSVSYLWQSILYHQLQAHLKVLQHPENHPTADDDVPYKKM